MKGFSPRIVLGLIDSFILCSFLRGGGGVYWRSIRSCIGTIFIEPKPYPVADHTQDKHGKVFLPSVFHVVFPLPLLLSRLRRQRGGQ